MASKRRVMIFRDAVCGLLHCAFQASGLKLRSSKPRRLQSRCGSGKNREIRKSRSVGSIFLSEKDGRQEFGRSRRGCDDGGELMDGLNWGEEKDHAALPRKVRLDKAKRGSEATCQVPR